MYSFSTGMFLRIVAQKYCHFPTNVRISFNAGQFHVLFPAESHGAVFAHCSGYQKLKPFIWDDGRIPAIVLKVPQALNMSAGLGVPGNQKHSEMAVLWLIFLFSVWFVYNIFMF